MSAEENVSLLKKHPRMTPSIDVIMRPNSCIISDNRKALFTKLNIVISFLNDGFLNNFREFEENNHKKAKNNVGEDTMSTNDHLSQIYKAKNELFSSANKNIIINKSLYTSWIDQLRNLLKELDLAYVNAHS